MTPNETDWSTAITEVEPNRIRLRGYRIDELMGQVTFTQAIHLALVGELPSPEAGALLDAILVSSVDHGVTSPSTLAARTAASTGAPTNAALAAGILSINRHHGGAVEGCMELLHEALELRGKTGTDPGQAAMAVVKRLLEANRRLPGFGHRIHTADPRASRLFDLARKLGIAAAGVTMIEALRSLSDRLNRTMPINVDGAIAAVLIDLGLPSGIANALFMLARCAGLSAHIVDGAIAAVLIDLGLPSGIANALFMLARCAGLSAHIDEEKTRESPMRQIDPSRHKYDGTRERKI